MYAKDVAEFAHVLVISREMTFQLDWLRIYLILFCQLSGGVLWVTAPRLWLNFDAAISS